MRIDKIKLKNFRQYKEIELVFRNIESRDLNLIIAENGVGKTTLLNSLNWCLYGDEPHMTLKDKALPIPNMSVFQDLEVEDRMRTSVTVYFSSDDYRIRFKRDMLTTKSKDGEVISAKPNFRAIINNDGMETKKVEDEYADNRINKLMPKRIRKFFLFDGEQLDTYFTEETGANLEQAIFDISNIGVLNRLNSNLKTLETETRRDISRHEPISEKLNEEYDLLCKKEETLNANIEEIDKILYRLISKKDKLDNFLINQPSVKDIEKERKSLLERIDQNQERLLKERKRLERFIVEYSILLRSYPEMQKLLKLIEDKERLGKLPPSIGKRELKKILKDNICTICNRDLTSSSEEYIKKLYAKNSVENETIMILNKLSGNLERLIDKAKNYPKSRDDVIHSYSYVKDNNKKLKDDYNKVNLEYQQIADRKRISSYQKNRNQLEYEIQKTNTEKGRNKNKLENCIQDKEKKYKELENAMNIKRRHNEKTDIYELIRDSSTVLLSTIENIKQDVRKKIESEIQKNFFMLMWKEETFNKIELDENYMLSVYNDLGLDILGSCSAAERALLALSFTLALHKESGYSAPLVIDTPLARISGKLRSNFARILLEVSKDKQVILLLTEDEYSESVRSIFSNKYNSKNILKLIKEEEVEVENIEY